MRVLHLLVAGEIGGIEVLMRDYALFSSHENHFLFAWSGGTIAEQIEKSGSKVTVLNKEKDGSCHILKTILNICKNEKIDAVIVHHEAPLLRGALCLIKILYPSVRLISYVHRNAEDMCGYGVKISWIKKIIYELSFDVSDDIVAISEFVKKSIMDTFRVDEKKIKVIYNGVNVEKYYPVAYREHDNINIIYVGRLVEEKGVQLILCALAQLDKEINYHFNIIGDGSYKEELQELADKLGINKNVSFLGNRRDVSEQLQMSDVFIHVPIVDEGFGITVVEAMASGLVCICANSGALPELITNGENGFLVGKKNIDSLTNMLRQVSKLKGSEMLKEIRQRAIQKVQQFSVEIFANELDSII